MAAIAPEQSASLWLIAVCVLCEVALSASDFGVLPYGQLRDLAYEYAGFWPGLLDNWSPNFAAQPYTMFLSYAFLHGGLVHLAVNMVTLWSLGPAVSRRVRVRGFLIVFAVSALAGAVVFGLMAPSLRPMVGASGALFGLAGALLSWNYVDRYTARQGLLPVFQAVMMLVLLNVVLWWAMGGQLAWQTHAGGFVGGWIAALLVDPRPADADESV